MSKILQADALELRVCDPALLQQALRGDQVLAELLGVVVPANWTASRRETLQYVLQKLTADANQQHWWTYLAIYRPDNKLIGSGGYHGPPTANGVVELGYEIEPDYQGRGLATAFTRALVINAFAEAQVTAIIAHTLAKDSPSTSVLSRNSFSKVAELNDPAEGMLWRWQVVRPASRPVPKQALARASQTP